MSKDRTWPANVCTDPENDKLWNVRAIDGFVVFGPGVSKVVAEQACAAINEHFDLGAAS